MRSVPTETSWLEKIHTPEFAAMKGNIQADVAIIGAGITGITTAYMLAKKGKKVVLIDKASPAESTTAYTTAFLTQEIDTDMTELLSMFGENKTRQIWNSHGEAIDEIEKIIKTEKISCEFIRCPAYIYANDEKEWQALQEQANVFKKLHLHASLHKNDHLQIPNSGYLEIPNQAKFHPIKYLNALLTAIKKHGTTVFYHTEATAVTHGVPGKISTKSGTITANHIVIATYLPLGNPIETFAKKGEYISYVLEAEIKKNSVSEAIYWDMHNPYHYFRIDKEDTHDRIIIGGDDHRREIPFDEKKQYKKLHRYLDKMMGEKEYKLIRKWKGSIVENAALAMIGKSKKHTYVATGFSGNGMTYGTIAAMIISDNIRGKKNTWETLYDPKQLPGVKQIALKTFDYAEEFVNEIREPVQASTHAK